MGWRDVDPLTPGLVRGDVDTGPSGWDSVEVGRVKAVAAAGATVVLAGAPLVEWGPAPWSLGAADTPAAAIADGAAPRVGDRCLVAFAGADHVPWLLAWWRSA